MSKPLIVNKLVRDDIPRIIKNGGQDCEYIILSDDEYIKALDSKLNEELKEYHESHSVEELADLLEVILAVSRARGYTMERLKNTFVEKREKRGGFNNRIFLKCIYTEEKDE